MESVYFSLDDIILSFSTSLALNNTKILSKEAQETKPDKLDRLDRWDRSLLEHGILGMNLSDVAARIAPNDASAEEISDLKKRIGRFFRDNAVQVERVGVGERRKIRIALIPPGHHLLAST